jgi:hypothetical protein
MNNVPKCHGVLHAAPILLNESDIKKKTSIIESIFRLDKYADTATLTTANTAPTIINIGA